MSLSVYPEQNMLPGMLAWHAAPFWKGLDMPNQHDEQYVPLRDPLARHSNKTQFFVCLSLNFEKLVPLRSIAKFQKWVDVSPLLDTFNAQWRLAFVARRATECELYQPSRKSLLSFESYLIKYCIIKRCCVMSINCNFGIYMNY